MNSSSSNGWKDAAKVIGILYLIGVLWMHVPSVFRSLVGGTRRIEIEQNTTGFYLVERSWWFGDTRRFRFVLVTDRENPGFRKWVSRLETKNGKNIHPGTLQGSWDDVASYSEDDGYDSSGPFTYNLR